MITKTLDDNTISFVAEDSDDLLTIRRLIKGGDKIIGAVSYTHLTLPTTPYV